MRLIHFPVLWFSYQNWKDFLGQWESLVDAEVNVQSLMLRVLRSWAADEVYEILLQALSSDVPRLVNGIEGGFIVLLLRMAWGGVLLSSLWIVCNIPVASHASQHKLLQSVMLLEKWHLFMTVNITWWILQNRFYWPLCLFIFSDLFHFWCNPL